MKHKHNHPLARFVVTAWLGVAGAVAGCTAMAPSATPPGQNLYERLGGRPGIVSLLDDAIGNLANDPRISPRFRHSNAQHLRDHLVDLLCLRAGGPCVYTGRNMADAHDGMQIRDDEFDDLIEDIAKSFDKFKVPAAERREALALLAQMRNAIVGH